LTKMSEIAFEQEKFMRACEKVLQIQNDTGFCENISIGKNKKSRTRAVSREGYTNIGGLCESSLHLILKYYIEENSDFHEVGCGRYQLDVCKDDMVYEIQTRNFSSFRNKLTSILSEKMVCVVFPVTQKKRIVWTNPDTGEVSGFRKSPKKETPLTMLSELIYLLPLLSNEKLSFTVITLACDDYKLLCGWSKDKKKGSVRYNRIPTELIAVQNFSGAEAFLAEYLPTYQRGELLTSAVLSDNTQLTKNEARIALKLLCALGFAAENGKNGRFIQYEMIQNFKGTGNE